MAMQVFALDRGVPAAPRPWLAHALTLLAVLIGWVIFRCEGAAHVQSYLRAMFGLGTADGLRYTVGLVADPFFVLTLAAGVVGSVPWLAVLRAYSPYSQQLAGTPGSGGWGSARKPLG